MSEFVTAYTTLADVAAARELARKVLKARLAACANIIPGVTSLYHWQDAVAEDQEVVVLFKTRGECVTDLEQLLLAEHPYETPAFTVFSLERASQAYGRWIEEETAPVAK